MIAALGDLEICRRARRGHQARKKIVLGLGLESEANWALAGFHVVEKLDDAAVGSGADDAVDLRNERLQLFAIALSEATRNHQLLTAALTLRVLEDDLGGFGFGRIDERTGVDDDRIRILRIADELVPCGTELGDHDFGVDQILGAAKADEVSFHALPKIHELQRHLEIHRFQIGDDLLQVVAALARDSNLLVLILRVHLDLECLDPFHERLALLFRNAVAQRDYAPNGSAEGRLELTDIERLDVDPAFDRLALQDVNYVTHLHLIVGNNGNLLAVALDRRLRILEVEAILDFTARLIERVV